VGKDLDTNLINKNCKSRHVKLLKEKSITLLLIGIKDLPTRSLTLTRDVSISKVIVKEIIMMKSILLFAIV
jgi:hypothetical protein